MRDIKLGLFGIKVRYNDKYVPATIGLGSLEGGILIDSEERHMKRYTPAKIKDLFLRGVTRTLSSKDKVYLVAYIPSEDDLIPLMGFNYVPDYGKLILNFYDTVVPTKGDMESFYGNSYMSQKDFLVYDCLTQLYSDEGCGLSNLYKLGITRGILVEVLVERNLFFLTSLRGEDFWKNEEIEGILCSGYMRPIKLNYERVQKEDIFIVNMTVMWLEQILARFCDLFPLEMAYIFDGGLTINIVPEEVEDNYTVGCTFTDFAMTLNVGYTSDEEPILEEGMFLDSECYSVVLSIIHELAHAVDYSSLVLRGVSYSRFIMNEYVNDMFELVNKNVDCAEDDDDYTIKEHIEYLIGAEEIFARSIEVVVSNEIVPCKVVNGTECREEGMLETYFSLEKSLQVLTETIALHKGATGTVVKELS